MDSVVAALGTSFAAEALKAWGPYVFVVVLLGLWNWHRYLETKDLKAELKAAREENRALQDKRIEDAQKLIRVTETGTAPMASRSENDQRFLGVFKDLAAGLADVTAKIDALEPEAASRPRRLPRRREPR